MIPYDPGADCSKCGHGAVDTLFLQWRAAVTSFLRIGPSSKVPREALGRECKRCKHRWLEIPIDQEGV